MTRKGGEVAGQPRLAVLPVMEGVCRGSGSGKTKLQQNIEQKVYSDMYRTWEAGRTSHNHTFNLNSQYRKDS